MQKMTAGNLREMIYRLETLKLVLTIMVSKLKTKTSNDAQVDAAYNLYTDWP